MRLLVEEVLRTSGYTVLAAGGGEEAIGLAQHHRGPIHLLIADVVMPGLSGREVAERLRQARPGTRVMFISGYNQDVILRHGVAAGDVVLLQKPFVASAQLQQVRAVLDPVAAPTNPG